MILDVVEGVGTQIILGRPFLATAGGKIDVKDSRFTFDVGKNHAEFGLFKGLEFSPSTLLYYGCDVLLFDSPKSLLL